jgi:hypothetical protein
MNVFLSNLALVPVALAVGFLLGRVSVLRARLERAEKRLDGLERTVHGTIIMDDPLAPETPEDAERRRRAVEHIMTVRLKSAPSDFDG